MVTLTPGQRTVLGAFAGFGQPLDDQGLAVYVHHVAQSGMSSSGIRTRRCELERAGLVCEAGRIALKSGKHAALHTITAKGRKVLGSSR